MFSKIALSALSLFFTVAALANESIEVKNNADVPLTLSNSNYNRLVMKNDRIVDFAFPDGAMGLKRDEQDGSVYIIPTTQNPFTLFLATESGRHFSVTVNAEEALGKTIELIANFREPSAPTKRADFKPNLLPREEQSFIALIKHMEEKTPLTGFSVKNVRKIERWKRGLTLTKRSIWQGSQLQGEVIELYNAGRVPLVLDEAWFNQEETAALKFSQKELPAKQTAYLYRVNSAIGESQHG